MSDLLVTDTKTRRSYLGLLPTGEYGMVVLNKLERIFPLEPTKHYRVMAEQEINDFWEKLKAGKA